jgi:hypothetical protein
MITWSVQGAALEQFAVAGIVTWYICVPLWLLPVVALAGMPKPSANTGWVRDQTGFLMIGGVHVVACGSGIVVAVCVELAPSWNAIRHQPVWATVAVTDTVICWPGWTTVTAPVGVPVTSAKVPGPVGQAGFFCGPPDESCDSNDAGELSRKCASTPADASRLMAPMEIAAATSSLRMGTASFVASPEQRAGRTY